MASVGAIFKKSVSTWWASNPGTYGAALAYYTVFSIAPLIVLLTLIVGIFIGGEATGSYIIRELERVLGSQAANVIQFLVSETAVSSTTNIITTVVALGTLVFGGLGFFSQLQVSLNHLWQATPVKQSGVMIFIKDKLAALLMVVGLGSIILLSLLLSALAALFSYRLGSLVELIALLNPTVSFVLVVGMFVFVYRYLPAVRISWTATVWGAIITGVLFMLGRFLIEWYLTHSSVVSSYGAAGAIVFILIWIYYSAHIFFFGAACTYAIDGHMRGIDNVHSSNKVR